MSQDNTTTTAPTTELERAIKSLEERPLAYQEESRKHFRRLAISLAPCYAIQWLLPFIGLHEQWQKYLLLSIVAAPMLVFALTVLTQTGDRKVLPLARNLARFDDPAIVWPLLPKLGSLDHSTYCVVSDALILVLGRCDEWHSGEWTDEERLILQNAAEWLGDRDSRPDPELAEVVQSALMPALGAARPTLVRSVSRAVPRWRRGP